MKYGKVNNMNREEIIIKLGNLTKNHSNSGVSHKLSYTMKRWELELVADFIIADRKRIVEPLVNLIGKPYAGVTAYSMAQEEAIEKTIKLAEFDL